MAWNPAQYEKFADERARPFHDLIRLVAWEPRMRIVDLGCGTGDLTVQLRAESEESIVEGVDSSSAMIERGLRKDVDGVRFVLGDLASYGDRGAYDLVFSNAALHWLGDHATLVPRLLRLARRGGGQIAWQIPSNHRHPAHALIADRLVREEPFKTLLGGYVGESPVLEVDQYARLLHGSGAREIEAVERVYCHDLGSVAGVVEWTRGTTLLPYLERLPPEVHDALFDRYRELLKEELGAQLRYFYTFRRILLHAVM